VRAKSWGNGSASATVSVRSNIIRYFSTPEEE